jgi:demethylmenaquinone methyltransferase / 2-methoxy-6-polyprenyl-1,4-benzoquinol methylase
VSGGYFVEGEGRAAGVAALFSRIAPRYDLINDLQSFGLHRLWKRRVVRLANPRPGRHALDLCCGTGDIAFALAARGADVIGADFSAPMLHQARRRSESRGDRKDSPRFIQADALHLPFSDASFDLVTVGYGLRNFADLDRGLSEIVRVVKPGGRIVSLDFGLPANPFLKRLWLAHLGIVIPWFGRLFAGDAAAYAYLKESLLRYPAQAGVDARLASLGCSKRRVINLLGGVMAIHVADRDPH